MTTLSCSIFNSTFIINVAIFLSKPELSKKSEISDLSTNLLYRKINQKQIKQATTITRLPLAWKLFTGIIANEIYGFLEIKGTLPEEQKRCKRKSKETSGKLGNSYT